MGTRVPRFCRPEKATLHLPSNSASVPTYTLVHVHTRSPTGLPLEVGLLKNSWGLRVHHGGKSQGSHLSLVTLTYSHHILALLCSTMSQGQKSFPRYHLLSSSSQMAGRSKQCSQVKAHVGERMIPLR